MSEYIVATVLSDNVIVLTRVRASSIDQALDYVVKEIGVPIRSSTVVKYSDLKLFYAERPEQPGERG